MRELREQLRKREQLEGELDAMRNQVHLTTMLKMRMRMWWARMLTTCYLTITTITRMTNAMTITITGFVKGRTDLPPGKRERTATTAKRVFDGRSQVI